MVARHRQIEFASGALVFPGGSVEPDDADQRLHQRAEGADTVDPAMFPILVAAALEAFEECGVLFARAATGGPLMKGHRAVPLGLTYRHALDTGEYGPAVQLGRYNLGLLFGRVGTVGP